MEGYMFYASGFIPKPQKTNLVQGNAVESTVMNILINLYA